MKLDVKMNADDVVKKLERMISLKGNFAPLFVKILGTVNDGSTLTLRGASARRFTSQQDPSGKAWSDLKPKYAARKAIEYPGKTILIRRGDLFRSLVATTWASVAQIQPTKLIYGTAIPYAVFHQFGTKFMPARKMLGISAKQKKAFKQMTAAYVRAAWEGKK